MFMNICVWLISILLASLLFTIMGCTMVGYDQKQRER